MIAETKVQSTRLLTFDRYRLELPNARLWCGARAVVLTRKTLAVLQYLAEHAGQLVTKEELFTALWQGTVVSDGALAFCIVELRKALHDSVKRPKFIATVHGRGYRFLAPVTAVAPDTEAREPDTQTADHLPQANGDASLVDMSHRKRAPLLVGRQRELHHLHNWWDAALTGARQLVFVTGEPGIGKTTLVEAFLVQVERRTQASLPIWVGRGQCLHHFGPSEPYLPLLEALGRLCRAPDGERLLAVLRQYAPSWVAQLPALLPTAAGEAAQRDVATTTRERMLREMGDAIDVITAERPLVLWLEDVHWSDGSTVDMLAALARRREHARLLVIGTYRPVDTIVDEHPLRVVKQELQLHGLCAELPLSLLSETHVAAYLTARLTAPVAGSREGGPERHQLFPPSHDVARLVHRRTDGNPLFMVTLVEDLIEQHVLVHQGEHWSFDGTHTTAQTWTPRSLQHMIEHQLARLRPEERRLVEAASVVGVTFSAAAVAAGLGREVEMVEAHCEALARREHILRTQGVERWPDGTVASHYGFVHALYQEVLYDQLPAGQRRQLHRRIGERLAQAHGDRAYEVAAALAEHLAQGGEESRAAQYFQLAGQKALSRAAPQEALKFLTRGLELLSRVPDTTARAQQELRLQYALGSTLLSVQGATAPDLERVYGRVLALCQRVGEPPYLFWVHERLWNRAFRRTVGRTRQEYAEQLLPLPQKDGTLLSRLPSALTLGVTQLFLGELRVAREHFEEGIAQFVPQPHRSPFYGIACLAHAAHTLWYLGYPDRALTRSNEALALAQEVGHPYALAFALHWAAGLHRLRGEQSAVQARTAVLLSCATKPGAQSWSALGAIWRGWTLVTQGNGQDGLNELQQGFAARRALGAELWWTYYLALGTEAYQTAGYLEAGRGLLTEAGTLMADTGERFYEAELSRLQGVYALQQTGAQHATRGQHTGIDVAEASLHTAIAIARKQHAKAFELRASTDLARLWSQQGKHHAARDLLGEIYPWFTEGGETADVQQAKALLETLI
jgi:DNA-binding winged helix-turn-helix (wHTH) protein/predicted ATPase